MNDNTKKTAGQFIRFAMIGVINTLVDLAILNAETIITGIKDGSGYAIQKGLSFLVAVTVSYFLNKHWAFEDKSKKDEGKKFSQFLFVSIMGMLINVSVATITVTYLKAPINNLLNLSFLNDQVWVSIGALAGTAVGLIWNFTGYKIWVFKK
ncbi:MAG: GtrA family protein [Candidatus Moranbacteria bacterium]|jgi:putative flippase GtrA|nr:GtrA family protein [Candidatus Moranbacteria bacterium]MDD5652491.1 GtrA family protein [Candidatus Moranbacteria bacterium]MDX9855743.1 GtrA family protein [Candidatus Moranbacteria bacterium]